MFNFFKKKQTTSYARFVTCYFVCSREDCNAYLADHVIPKTSARKTFFLQERCARDFIKERNNKGYVIMELQVPEDQVKFFPLDDITCEYNSDINLITCYKKTIVP